MNPASEYIEAKFTTATIGRPLVDLVRLETSISILEITPGARVYRANLRVGDDIVELTATRARTTADTLRRMADSLDARAGDIDALNDLESNVSALLDGRARTVTV